MLRPDGAADQPALPALRVTAHTHTDTHTDTHTHTHTGLPCSPLLATGCPCTPLVAVCLAALVWKHSTARSIKLFCTCSREAFSKTGLPHVSQGRPLEAQCFVCGRFAEWLEGDLPLIDYPYIRRQLAKKLPASPFAPSPFAPNPPFRNRLETIRTLPTTRHPAPARQPLIPNPLHGDRFANAPRGFRSRVCLDPPRPQTDWKPFELSSPSSITRVLLLATTAGVAAAPPAAAGGGQVPVPGHAAAGGAGQPDAARHRDPAGRQGVVAVACCGVVAWC